MFMIVFLCFCFYDRERVLFLSKIVGIGSFELGTKLVLCFSLWVFSLIAYFKRKERRLQKILSPTTLNIVYHGKAERSCLYSI